ncbi:MAG: sugar phosphate isomerase/epimerase, partial [Kiritimatiellaeota bacterium]|nr:sugar phosphate isomerase/epimerase [Kiritimatiellota bacterium]
MNRTSIFAWYGHDLPHEKNFALIRAAGFDGVLLWWDKVARVGCDPDFRAQPALARKAGLFVENIHAPFDAAGNIWEDTAAGRAVFECYARCVEDCAAQSIPTMVAHASFGLENPPVSELGVERFKRLAGLAERLGVNIAVENKRRPGPCARAALLLERINSPRLGF